MKTTAKVTTQDTPVIAQVDETTVSDALVDTKSLASTMAFGEVGGDIEASDVTVPRLALVQGIGELSESYDSGDFVFDKNLLLAKPGTALLATVLSISKYYEEASAYDPDAPMPQRYFSKEDAIAAGLTVDWGTDNIQPTARTCAQLLLLLEKPEGVEDTMFPVEIQGKQYTPALFTVKNKSYSTTAKPVFSAVNFFLKKGLVYGEWKLYSQKERGKFTYQISVMKTIGRHDEAWVTEAKAMFSEV